MAEPQNSAAPIPQTEEVESSPNEGFISPDPLLGGGSYIDPAEPELAAESPKQEQPAANQEFAPGVVISAEPISMYLPGDDKEEADATPKSARRRNREEMSKRPSWLPEDWKIDLRVRSSGATAGLIDRYYMEPTGQRRFRSKNEVLHFLETGSKQKKRAAPETTAAATGQSGGPKVKKSSSKRKKADVVTPAPHANGVEADNV